MSELNQVYHGMAGSLKGKLKTPFLVYEDKHDAKEFANNYTDFSKQPKVIQFNVVLGSVLDLTKENSKKELELLVSESNIKWSDLFEENISSEEEVDYKDIDNLNHKKINKLLSEKFDIVKGYSILNEKKVSSYIVLNSNVLENKQVLEIDTNDNGNIWKINFKNN